MWTANNWNDYEVLDASKGEKLERWGDYLLIRPDPQVIWDTPRSARGWKHCNAHYHRSAKGGGEWEFFDLPKQWRIRYGELSGPLMCSIRSLRSASGFSSTQTQALMTSARLCGVIWSPYRPRCRTSRLPAGSGSGTAARAAL